MNEATKMGRKRLDVAEKRDRAAVVYLTKDEEIAVNLLGTDYGYSSASDAVRKAVAFLIQAKYPALQKYLRRDLIS